MRIRLKHAPDGQRDNGISPGNQLSAEKTCIIGLFKTEEDHSPKRKVGKNMNRQFTEKNSSGP